MNIHISELFVICLVALLVIKPNRLPEVVTKICQFVKGVRQLIAKIKAEMDAPLQKNSRVSQHEE